MKKVITIEAVRYLLTPLMRIFQSRTKPAKSEEPEELKIIQKRLLEKWNYDEGYWDPLEKKSPDDLYIVSAIDFHLAEDAFLSWLVRNEDYIFFYGEDGFEKCLASNLVVASATEAITTNLNSDWVIYESHENTVAFGGERLKNFAKNTIKNNIGSKWGY